MAKTKQKQVFDETPQYFSAELLMFNPYATAFGQISFIIGTYCVYLIYLPVVPTRVMSVWVYFASAVVTLGLAIDLCVAFDQPDHARLVKTWKPIGQALLLLADFSALLMVVLLMPYGSDTILLATMAYIMGFIPMQILCDPTARNVNRTGVVLVVGSAALFFAFGKGPLDHYMAVYMVIFGGLMFFVADAICRVVVLAIARHQESEASKVKLSLALHAVEQSRKAKTEFIAAASHDLQQPIRAASFFFEQTLAAKKGEFRQQAINGVRRAFSSTDQQLAHMMNYLRLEADEIKPNLAPVKVGEIFARIQNQYAPLASEQNMKLSVIGSKAFAFTDENLLERALSNLVNNAIHHSRGDRILVGVRSTKQKFLRFWVVDDGLGLKSLNPEKLFTDYYRGEHGNQSKSGGFGLGLASVKRIAKILNGTVGTGQLCTKGAAFYIEIPAI
jgi:two-component system, sensor histidine kinase